MRLLFFGMRGIFSLLPFEQLMASGHTLCAVAIPAEDRAGSSSFTPLFPPSVADSLDLPLISSFVEQSIVQRAWQQGIPVYAVSRLRAPDFLDWVRALRVDVACVACFNRIVPPALLDLPPHGFLNLHPSRLPDYRGPEPLFWQLRDGVNPVGVTVHWMSERLDEGDIAAQVDVPLPDGVDWRSIERRCAERGGALLVEVLAQLAMGQIARRPQLGIGSYQPMPTAEDFAIPLNWDARRAFNFMRGTAAWGMPYPLRGSDEPIRLAEAVDWSMTGRAGRVERDGDLLHIGFSTGTLIARTEAE